MIYTIGSGNSYRHGIKTLGKDFQKVGRNDVHKHDHIPDNYIGGYAFISEADAIKRISEITVENGIACDFEVFGLIADWDKDTVKSQHGWWHALLNDSQIVDKGYRKIKAITLWQPYGSLIAVGSKQYETRSWATNYRGQIAIHAAKTKHPSFTDVRRVLMKAAPNTEIPYGKVVCIANLVDCIEMTPELISQQTDLEVMCGDWNEGRYAWKLEDVKVLEKPIEAKGFQRIWNWDPPDNLNLIKVS